MLESDNFAEKHIPLPRLLPGETLISVEEIPLYIAEQPPSSIRELQRLARVKAGGEVGAFGPAMASMALEREGQEASPELRKYEVLFGRDSLRVAMDLLPMYPLLMHATIHALAEYQGVTTHAAREEEPGRIIHEARAEDDPIAAHITHTYGWEWPYYGSVDATPQYLRAICAYAEESDGNTSIFRETFTGRDSATHTIAESFQSALRWMEGRMDTSNYGLLEYKSTIPHGIENQVWRDSWDGYSHADGTLANRERGVASVEVQALAYDTLLDAARVYRHVFVDEHKADELTARAHALKEQIIDQFWVDEKGGYFALATDYDDAGNLRPLKIRTSNMGHLLRSRILRGEAYRPLREAVISQLFSPEMLNISGIRTLASDEVRFRPGAYQNGSVWLWDTYYIAEGLRNHGYYGLANLLAEKIHTVINVTQKFPEYVRGDNSPTPTLNTRIVDVWDENAGRVNRVEQPPQEVQAWSVAADIAREYYSGRVPERAIEARAIRFEDAILARLENEPM